MINEIVAGSFVFHDIMTAVFLSVFLEVLNFLLKFLKKSSMRDILFTTI